MRPQTILAIGAHPDDCELLCAGTLALLHGQGWHVEIATLTPGDCGSATLGREEISAIRKHEAAASAAVLDGNYQCLDCDDIFIAYDRPTLLKVITLIRLVRPALVFAMSPGDYMVDHEVTSMLTRTACFAAGMNNIHTEGGASVQGIPPLYYMDPMQGRDILGNTVQPSTIVDITGTMRIKEQMFLSHASQQSWLASHHGLDEVLGTVRELATSRGEIAGCAYAEGFRQHLGHAFPQGNVLREILRDFVHVTPPGERE